MMIRNENNIVKRSSAAMITVLFFTLWIIAGLIANSGIIPSLNPKIDKEKKLIIKTEARLNCVEGKIVDSNNDVISYAEQKGKPASCVFSAYGRLVGYNNERFGSWGLRGKFAKELFTPDKNGNGAQIKLTTLNSVQLEAYETIKGTDGCVVVLENSTGRVLALAASDSKHELDVNNLAADWEEMNKIDGFFINNYLVADAPGSTIKPIVSAAVIESGLENFDYNDTGAETVDGATFRNAGGASYGKIKLKDALVHSVNTYFAYMSQKIGSYQIAMTLERFYIGKPLDLDFTSVESQNNVLKSNSAEVAASAFGQGKLMVTPLNLAVAAQGIANDGAMMKPFLIDSITTEGAFGRKTILKGKKTVLGQCRNKETAAKIKGYMAAVAKFYGLRGGVYAKTGTADTKNGNRASLITFNEKYTVVIVINNTDLAGKNLVPAAERIYNVLEATI